MNIFAIALAGLAATAAAGADLTLPPPPDGPAPVTCDLVVAGGGESVRLRETFRDDFDRFDPAAGRWTPHFDHNAGDDWRARTLAANGEAQAYVDPLYRGSTEVPLGLEGHAVGDGLLRLVAKPAPAGAVPALHGFGFTSGMITSRRSFLQRYGYFEMRARLPDAGGTWPAFWLLAPGQWPPEIDVFEARGGRDALHLRMHWNDDGTHAAGGCDLGLPMRGTYHAFGLLWERQRLVWYLDRQPVAWVAAKPGLDRPMYLLATLALGGWAGPPDPAALPAELAIDWIAAWAVED